MDKASVLASLRQLGLVPVLRAKSVDQAILLAEAVADGASPRLKSR